VYCLLGDDNVQSDWLVSKLPGEHIVSSDFRGRGQRCESVYESLSYCDHSCSRRDVFGQICLSLNANKRGDIGSVQQCCVGGIFL
jgi:hypothetical protein